MSGIDYKALTEELGRLVENSLGNRAALPGLNAFMRDNKIGILRGLEALAAQQDGAWQPIETAPKDGRFILAVQAGPRDDGEPYVPDTIRWFDGRWDNGMSDRCYFEPTHWMPLQAPPAR